MSAESPHKSSSRRGHIVAPQPVSDRSIIESVAGFINEVVPQAYTSLPASESKECITWARFEYGDINDPALYPDTADDHSSTPPLLLVLGYGSGVQVWAVPANGEAKEVLSWRQGVVRTLRVLPTPLADAPIPDVFCHKRPLVALCDSAGPGPQFCSLSFISLRAGDQVKNITFKNPVSDVLANRRSVVVTFPERIAVFDACTLEDRLTVTTCYPCPGPNPNPVALGTRWLAYSERRLLPARRSSGGTEGEGVQSYTATVLHAAKSLGKGLRELGETVASSLTGGVSNAGMQRGITGGTVGQQGGTVLGGSCDSLQPGIVTILDAQGSSSSHGEEPRSADSGPVTSNADVMVAHFMAHSEPIVALAFDPSGMLLLTADKRGHDFHLFRVQPHPGGPSLAAVHHLYILHRGDTTAKVQDIAFAADSRWVAVSTLRGTTHVFPITPYGGPVGIRTHTTPHVVNRLSRFHRSAGLTADGRNSPVPTVCPTSTASSYESIVTSPAMPYPNPRLPPYPHPTVIAPLAQIRQPITHILLSGVAPMSPNATSQQAYHRNLPARSLSRAQSVSDEGVPAGGVPLRMAACFAPPRAWLVGSPTVPRESSNKAHKRAVDSLFVMACHGSLIEYDLEPKHVAGIPKEKVCDDTPIELEVQAKAQWLLLRPPHSNELQPPLPSTNPLMVLPDHLPPASDSKLEDADERWLSQVEIVTHAGPHRRLWMGPQFTFKTYTATSGATLSLLELEAVEVGTGAGSRPARSNPVNMPLSGGGRPIVPVLIESGSASSYEQSPRLIEVYGGDGGDSDGSAGPGDTQLREDLADAMMESPGVPIRDTGRRVIVTMRSKRSLNPIEKVVNPVGTVITVAVPSDDETGVPQSPPASCRERERDAPADSGGKRDGMVRWPTAVKSQHGEVTEREQWPVGEEQEETFHSSTRIGLKDSLAKHGSGIKSNRHNKDPTSKVNDPWGYSVRRQRKDQGHEDTAGTPLGEGSQSEAEKSQKKKKIKPNAQMVDILKASDVQNQEQADSRVGRKVKVGSDTDKCYEEAGLEVEESRSRWEPARIGDLNYKRENFSEDRSKAGEKPVVKKNIKKDSVDTIDDKKEESESTVSRRGDDSDGNRPKVEEKTITKKSKHKKDSEDAMDYKKEESENFILRRREDSDEERPKLEEKSTTKKNKYKKVTEETVESDLESFVLRRKEDSDEKPKAEKSISKKSKKKVCEGSLVYKREETEIESFVLSMADRKEKNLSEDEAGRQPCEQEMSIENDETSIVHDSTVPETGDFTFASGRKHKYLDAKHTILLEKSDIADRKHKTYHEQDALPMTTAEVTGSDDGRYTIQDRSSSEKGETKYTVKSRVKSRKLRGTTFEEENKAGASPNKEEEMSSSKPAEKLIDEKDSCKADVSVTSYSRNITFSSKQIDMLPLKTWSSIVSTPKEKSLKSCEDSELSAEKHRLWCNLAATGLNPDVLSSTLDLNEPCAGNKDSDTVRERITEFEDDMDIDIGKNIENNNKEELLSETNFPAMEKVLSKLAVDDTPITINPHRSWSSIVSSSPKAGASTDDGTSGEYDSNESKEYPDLGFDELEERPVASADTVTASVMVSTSSLGKPASEEEASSEPTVATTKKSRRAKKKRR